MVKPPIGACKQTLQIVFRAVEFGDAERRRDRNSVTVVFAVGLRDRMAKAFRGALRFLISVRGNMSANSSPPSRQARSLSRRVLVRHSANAISAYRSMLADVLPTPNIDRIAREGLRADACFCTNSICTTI